METEIEKVKRIMGKPTSEYIMPFGKYKGLGLSDIPDEYLKWIGSQRLDDRRLFRSIELELNRPARIPLK